MPEPSRIPQAWAADGDYNIIPTTNPGMGLCSWPLGFPTETQTPIAAGGTPPRRQDMNGALNWLSKHLLWTQQGGLWQYDALENYEIGNIVLQNNSLYYCIRANGPASTVRSPANDSAGTYWRALIYSTGKHPDPDHLANPAVLQVLQAVYPVGSIYCSYGNTSPAVLFGFGTWTKIEGRFLLGANATYGLGSTGGAATVALTVAQLPAHSHGASSASAGAHTHTVSGTAASAGAHTHNASSTSNGAHTHEVDGTAASAGAHSHSASSASAGAHTHTITVNSGGAHTHSASSASSGSHTHTRGTMEITGAINNEFSIRSRTHYVSSSGAITLNKATRTIRDIGDGSADETYGFSFMASRSWTGATSSNGAHTHTITVNSGGAHTHSASSASAGVHTHNITVNSGGAHTHNISGTAASAGAHTHTITVNSGGAHTHNISGTANSAGAHTHSITVSNTGSGQAHSNMPPYLAVNMWRRTA